MFQMMARLTTSMKCPKHEVIVS